MIYRNVRRLLTFPVIFLALNIQAQNILDKTGLGAGATAAAAYSTRLLSSSYAGYALRVLRTSDNSTADIGFTAGGDLDIATLSTFVGSSNGQVTIWYDQSGHGLDLTQATPANQPVLVNAGVVNTENGQPFIRFYGSGSAYNSLNLAADMTTVGHVSAVLRFDASGDGFILSHLSDYYWHSNPPNYLFNSTYASGAIQGGNAWSNGSGHTPTLTPWPSTLTVAELEPSTPSSGTTWDNIGSDRNAFHDISLGGGYGELILFSTALSTADRQMLENNEMTRFSISTLPVTWLSFTARAEGNNILLQWQTASKQNSKDFIVQYSPDGSSWTDLATLPAAGNSFATRTYHYVRNDPPPGDNYYRILQTDFDGKATYSSIDLVKIQRGQDEFKLLRKPRVHGRNACQHQHPHDPVAIYDGWKIALEVPLRTRYKEIRLDGYARGEYILTGKSTSVQLLLK